jgi:hypothetical protein
VLQEQADQGVALLGRQAVPRAGAHHGQTPLTGGKLDQGR